MDMRIMYVQRLTKNVGKIDTAGFRFWKPYDLIYDMGAEEVAPGSKQTKFVRRQLPFSLKFLVT
jgi:hypothetical protein